jgi:hypothetical protein
MSLNNKDTKDTGQKILRSTLSQVYKAALDKNFIVEGKALDDTDIEEPSIIIRDLSDQAQKGFDNNHLPGDMVDISSTILAGDRILSHVFSLDLDLNTLSFLRETMKSLRIEKEIENQLGLEILRKFYQSDPAFLTGLIAQFQNNFEENFSKVKFLGIETSFFTRMNLSTNKSSVYYGSRVPGTVSYDFLEAGIDDIHRSVYSSNFGPYTLLFASNLNSKDKFNFKDQYKEELQHILNDMSGKSPSQRFFPAGDSPVSFPPPHSKSTLTSIMYQHLHDASFSLNHGVSPYSWNSLGYEIQEISSGDSHNNHENLEGDLPPLLRDLGYNKDLVEMRNSSYPSREELQVLSVATATNQEPPNSIESVFEKTGIDATKEDFVIDINNNVSVPHIGSNSGPSLDISSPSAPGSRVMEWLNEGEPFGGENSIARLGRISSVIASEIQMSAGISSLPEHMYDPKEGNTEPLGDKIFGEFKERMNLLNEVSTKAPGILFPIVPEKGHVYFYERAIRFKDFQGSQNGKDLTTEYITPYVAATRRFDRSDIVSDLDEVVQSQDERAKRLWDNISGLNQYSSNEDLLSDEQLDHASSAYLHVSSRNSLVGSRSPEHVSSIVLEIFQSLHSFIYNRRQLSVGENFKKSNLPKRILSQMHGLMLTSKGSNNQLTFSNKKKLRNCIIAAVVNRDMVRAMDNIPVGMEIDTYMNEVLGEYSTKRRIGYTKAMIRRHTTQINLLSSTPDVHLDAKIARSDNLRYNVARYVAWSLNQGIHTFTNFHKINKVTFAYGGDPALPHLRRNQPESAKTYNRVGDFVAYIAGDILDNSTTLNAEADTFAQVDPTAITTKYDLYDMIIRAVDRIDESIGRTIDSSKSQNLVDSEVSEQSDLFAPNYFHSDAGITRASGFDRSLLIALVVDAVAELLGASFKSNLFVKFENSAWQFRGFYDEGNINPNNGKYAYEKPCAIEIFPKGLDLHPFRNRKAKIGEVQDKIKWPYDPAVASDYSWRFRDVMNTEKTCASLASLGMILSPTFVHKYMKNGRIEKLSDVHDLWKACVVEMMIEGPLEFSRTSLKSPTGSGFGYKVYTKYKKIFGESTVGSYNLLGSQDINNFSAKVIAELAPYINSHKGSLKSVTEFINLHASYMDPLRSFVEVFKDSSSFLSESYPDHLACSYSSPGQFLKSLMRLDKMRTAVSAAPDEDDNFFFRERIDPKMWMLVEKFIDYAEENIPEFDQKKIVFYGTTPGSFYEALSNFTDESPEFGNWPAESSYVPIKTIFNVKKTNPLDENIDFSNPEEDIPDVDLNIILDETAVLSSVSADSSWEEIANSVIFISPTQALSYDKIPSVKKNSPSSILSHFRETIGFSVNSILESQNISDDEEEKLKQMARRKLGDFCYKFLINSIYSLELRDEKIIRENVKGLIKNPSVGGEDFVAKFRNSLSSIDVDLKDIFEKLTSSKAKHITEPKGFDGNSITQSSGLRRARMPMGTELKRSLKPSAKISANGTPYIAPPDLNDQEIYVGDILFSSLFMYDHRLLFGTPLFEDIVSVEFDNENTKCIPRFDGRYLANPDNGTPHPGLEDLANSRTVKVIRPEVFISLQSLSSVI